MAQILEIQGYRAYQAENGQQALDWIEAVPPPPGLILLDFDMPVMGGREFLSRLAHLPGETPMVIVITGQDPRIVPGAAAVLRKPISLSQLLGLMQSLMLAPEHCNGKGN